jgi:periplasmic divalent cation tolerance protein
MKKFILVLTALAEEKKAQEIAEKLVEERLAACVTVLSASHSFYWWKGKITKEQEYILYIKTKTSVYDKLEARLQELHPYDVPEIIALPVEKGSEKYLAWVGEETRR